MCLTNGPCAQPQACPMTRVFLATAAGSNWPSPGPRRSWPHSHARCSISWAWKHSAMVSLRCVLKLDHNAGLLSSRLLVGGIEVVRTPQGLATLLIWLLPYCLRIEVSQCAFAHHALFSRGRRCLGLR